MFGEIGGDGEFVVVECCVFLVDDFVGGCDFECDEVVFWVGDGDVDEIDGYGVCFLDVWGVVVWVGCIFGCDGWCVI